jgi:hypothetical protein
MGYKSDTRPVSRHALLAAQACAFEFVRRQGQPFFAHAPLPHRTGRPPTLYCSVISRVI